MVGFQSNRFGTRWMQVCVLVCLICQTAANAELVVTLTSNATLPISVPQVCVGASSSVHTLPVLGGDSIPADVASIPLVAQARWLSPWNWTRQTPALSNNATLSYPPGCSVYDDYTDSLLVFGMNDDDSALAVAGAPPSLSDNMVWAFRLWSSAAGVYRAAFALLVRTVLALLDVHFDSTMPQYCCCVCIRACGCVCVSCQSCGSPRRSESLAAHSLPCVC